MGGVRSSAIREKEFRGCVRERTLLIDLMGFWNCGPTEGCRVAVTGDVARGIGRSVAKRRVSGQPNPGTPSRRGEKLVLFWFVLDIVNFTDFASHAKISDFADTHFVDKHIL
jgi:hypothetical protein